MYMYYTCMYVYLTLYVYLYACMYITINMYVSVYVRSFMCMHNLHMHCIR